MAGEEGEGGGKEEPRAEVPERGAAEPTEGARNEAQPEETVESVRERLLRLAAEFDNYKKRVAKEIDASKGMGRAEAVAKILPNMDEFDLAIAAMGKGDGERGMLLVYSNFTNTLKGLGLREIETTGTFDPYKHEIMLTRASDKKEGTILEVVRKGYTLNGIMLRPASVIVSNGKPEAGEEKQDERG